MTGFPIVALVWWMSTNPLITPFTVWQWVLLRTQSATQASVVWLVDHASTTGLLDVADRGWGIVQALPVGALTGFLANLAILVSLSIWGLIRLTRTPVVTPHHAN